MAEENAAGEIFVIAQLNARVGPLSRGEFFEDPLLETLETLGIGEVAGGGTLSEQGGEIIHCDIEIRLRDASERAYAEIVARLEALGAPKGSMLLISQGDDDDPLEIPFGAHEGLALYLRAVDPDLVDPPPEIDGEALIAELNAALGGAGRVLDLWAGEREIALYCYGPSVETMRAALKPFLDADPRAGDARLEQIA